MTLNDLYMRALFRIVFYCNSRYCILSYSEKLLLKMLSSQSISRINLGHMDIELFVEELYSMLLYTFDNVIRRIELFAVVYIV